MNAIILNIARDGGDGTNVEGKEFDCKPKLTTTVAWHFDEAHQ